MTFAELNPPYATIVADPPWKIPARIRQGGRRARATTVPYSMMTLDDIKALPVGTLADNNCALWLWVTPAFNRRGSGVAVAEAWGFRVTGELIWSKPNLGMGAFPRTSHEVLLIAKKGKIGADWPRDVHSVQRWAQVYAWGKTHSAKPPAALDLIEAISPSPRLELFARAPRLGWDAWGFGFESAA